MASCIRLRKAHTRQWSRDQDLPFRMIHEHAVMMMEGQALMTGMTGTMMIALGVMLSEERPERDVPLLVLMLREMDEEHGQLHELRVQHIELDESD